MAKRKSLKGKRVMIYKEELEELEMAHFKKATTETIAKEFSKRILSPFDDILTALEERREEIEDLKPEIDNLAN